MSRPTLTFEAVVAFPVEIKPTRTGNEWALVHLSFPAGDQGRQIVPVACFGQSVGLAKSIEAGTPVRVTVGLKGNPWMDPKTGQTKHFVNLMMEEWTMLQAPQAAPQPQYAQQPPPQPQQGYGAPQQQYAQPQGQMAQAGQGEYPPEIAHQQAPPQAPQPIDETPF